MELSTLNDSGREDAFPRREFSGPIYLQVAEMLRGSITEGNFRHGIPLPSEHDLARSFSVSVGTMRKAMMHLVEEGLIFRRRGRGTFVCEKKLRRHHGELVNASGRDDCSVSQHVIKSRSAGEEDAVLLGIDEDTRVWCIECLHDDPQSYRILQKAKIVGTVFPFGIDAEALKEMSLTQILRLGKSPIGNIEERICAIAADADLADILGTQPNHPLLRVRRQFYDHRGVIVAFDEQIIFHQDAFYAFSGTPGSSAHPGL